jgi:hypothetical protein
MAKLLHNLALEPVQLLPQNIVGRDRICELRLNDPLCSGRHAHILWTGKAWELHDLSSRNGTWVNGRRIDRTEPAVLAVGMQIAFGNPPKPWHVVDTSPPVACAISDDGTRLFVNSSVLALPNEDNPLATLFADSAGVWWLERPDVDAEICPGELQVTIGQRSWRIVTPNLLDPTRDFVQNNQMRHVQLTFLTSIEHDEVLIEALSNGVAIHLETRRCHRMLLALARVRLADHERGVSQDHAGWMHKNDLMDALDWSETDTNQQIYRARRQFASAGVTWARGLIERQTTGGLVRLGVRALKITDPD